MPGQKVPPLHFKTALTPQMGTFLSRQPPTTSTLGYTETVTDYITNCIDDMTHTKNISIQANQNPWLTGEVYRLLKDQNELGLEP